VCRQPDTEERCGTNYQQVEKQNKHSVLK
jgi:hypothetical protein